MIGSIRSASPAPWTTAPPSSIQTPQQAADEGWLGQVPPPDPPSACPTPPSMPPQYAIPELAPDPWLEPAPLFPDDPTLFG